MGPRAWEYYRRKSSFTDTAADVSVIGFGGRGSSDYAYTIPHRTRGNSVSYRAGTRRVGVVVLDSQIF